MKYECEITYRTCTHYVDEFGENRWSEKDHIETVIGTEEQVREYADKIYANKSVLWTKIRFLNEVNEEETETEDSEETWTVSYTDQEGSLQEMQFDNKDDAEIEAACLAETSEYVQVTGPETAQAEDEYNTDIETWCLGK